MLDSAGYLRPLSVGDRLRQHEIIVTGPDGYARFQLSDGSTFDVYSNSKVVFRETPGITDLLDLFIGRVKGLHRTFQGSESEGRQNAHGGDFRARHGV